MYSFMQWNGMLIEKNVIYVGSLHHSFKVNECSKQAQNNMYRAVTILRYLHNNTLAHGTVTNDDDVGLHEYSC